MFGERDIEEFLNPWAPLTITYFTALSAEITEAFPVTLVAAGRQALLAVVQLAVLTQLDSFIPLQRGLLIFPESPPGCCQKLGKFSPLFLFLVFSTRIIQFESDFINRSWFVPEDLPSLGAALCPLFRDHSWLPATVLCLLQSTQTGTVSQVLT